MFFFESFPFSELTGFANQLQFRLKLLFRVVYTNSQKQVSLRLLTKSASRHFFFRPLFPQERECCYRHHLSKAEYDGNERARNDVLFLILLQMLFQEIR